jgi:YidC/Oxa1 family membrane protein insertase
MEDYGRPAQPQVVQERGNGRHTLARHVGLGRCPPGRHDPDALTPGRHRPICRQRLTEMPIRIETDVFHSRSRRRGGTVSAAWLLDYATVAERPDDPFQLFKPVPPNMFIAQSGCSGEDPSLLPTHEAIFEGSQTLYSSVRGREHARCRSRLDQRRRESRFASATASSAVVMSSASASRSQTPPMRP